MYAIKNIEDRDHICLNFQKHIREIFTDLNDFRKDKDFLNYMECLKDNIKNLAAHVRGQLDKKAEKTLISQIKQDLSDSEDDLLNELALILLD